MKRLCVCGCKYEKHQEIKFNDDRSPILYCMGCNHCWDYKPIGNLEYLEWILYGR